MKFFEGTFLPDFVIPSKGESLLTAYDRWRGWADEKVGFQSNVGKSGDDRFALRCKV